MSYPAYVAFAADPERTYARWCVYMAIQPPFLDFAEPREKKLEVIRRRAQLSRRATIDALRWMTERGYVADLGAGPSAPRRYRLAYALPEPRSQICTPSSAA